MWRHGKWVKPGIALLGVIVLGGRARAEPDLYLNGSLSLGGTRDDNIFYTAESRQSDLVSRLTPGLEAGSRSERLTLAGRWALDAERFTDHTELNTNRARESASFDLHSRWSRPLTFSLHGDYLSTLTPGELNLATGLSAGRRRARRVSGGPSLDWKLGPTTDGTLGYTLTKDDLVGGIPAQTRAAALGLEHRLSPRTTATAGYNFNRYTFEGVDPVNVHTLTLGCEREIGPKSSITLRAGPRYSEHRFDPEASLALQRGGKRIDSSLTLARSQTTVLGEAGTFVTNSVLSALSYKPRPSLRLSATPGVYWIKDALGGPQTRVYALGLEGSWRVSDWLSFVTTYRRNLQRGTLVAAVPGTGNTVQEISRNTFFVGLLAGWKETRAPAAAAGSAGGTP